MPRSRRITIGVSGPVGWLCTDDPGRIAANVFADPPRWVGANLSLASDVRSIDECKESGGRSPAGVPRGGRCLSGLRAFVGTDLTTMWRWLRAEDFQPCTQTAGPILP